MPPLVVAVGSQLPTGRGVSSNVGMGGYLSEWGVFSKSGESAGKYFVCNISSSSSVSRSECDEQWVCSFTNGQMQIPFAQKIHLFETQCMVSSSTEEGTLWSTSFYTQCLAASVMGHRILIIFTGPQSSLSCDSEEFDVAVASEYMKFFSCSVAFC